MWWRKNEWMKEKNKEREKGGKVKKTKRKICPLWFGEFYYTYSGFVSNKKDMVWIFGQVEQWMEEIHNKLDLPELYCFILI